MLALRRKQVKNFCCLLLLSNGTPMFRAGDEFLNTQFGNNNPYNQDNETGWLDWSQLQANAGYLPFFQKHDCIPKESSFSVPQQVLAGGCLLVRSWSRRSILSYDSRSLGILPAWRLSRR